MSKAVLLKQHGGPEELLYQDVSVATAADNEVRIKQTAIGLNYIDVYHRSGLYPIETMPAPLGMEAAGVVEAIGKNVTNLKLGDRVAYASGPLGAYAELRCMPADRLVKLPDEISDQQAAAMMLQGMTVEYLVCRTYPVKANDWVLLHAAAGGVGLIACQWLRHLGAKVIGTVSTDEKAKLAKQHGCDYTINYREENLVEQVKKITHGAGVHVVYDSVGKDTFMASLDCLRPRGMLVSFGNSSGATEAFDPGLLGKKGSLFLTRPSLMTYTADAAEMQQSAAALFSLVKLGAIKININQTYPLSEVVQAHRDLEARKTTGSTVLLP